MNEELISQIYSVKSSTVDHMKGLLEDVKNHKTQHLESRIRELEKELKNIKKSKRYGLVWEDKPEDVVERCKSELPMLKEVTSRRITKADDDLNHILIEGDNFHALSTLAYTHAGKIDVIYIDPPYNTGATDWKYNNNYVDGNDTFRHSKWLSMMNNRLKIAKRLLKDDGVLICAIDENEACNIGVLLEELFSSHEVHQITVVHNPRGIQGTNFSYTNEFLFYVIPRGIKTIGPRKIEEQDIKWRNLRDNGGESLRTDARNCFYPIIVKKDKIIGFGEIPDINFHPKSNNIVENEITYIYPIDPQRIERKWRYARQSVEKIQNLLRVKKGRNGLEIELGKDFGTVKTVWQDSRHDANENGTKLIQKIFPGIDFTFPKSLWAVYDSIYPVVESRQNAIILDFFAGSGTTGHAVLELNKEDGGKRQCVLCTNNENQIAEEVTYPRMKNVIEGYADVEGIPANLRYYQTEFIKVEKSLDDLRYQFMGLCDELLCIKENTFEEVKLKGQSDELKLYKNSSKNLVILYDIHHFDACTKLLRTLENPTKVYIFSLAKEIYEEAISGIGKDIEIANIPDDILQTYKKIFQF